MTELYPKDHRILDKGVMEFRPFGRDFRGHKIRDASGVTVQANVELLQELVTKQQGPGAGEQAVQLLARRLNERIQDPAYHVTPEFLKNVWNSYSYEFVLYLAEFCEQISGEPEFQAKVGRLKFISPIIQTLGRPFSVPQIYKMFPHFGQKFAKGSIEFGVGKITNHSAVLRMRFTEEVYRQFGSYRKRCAAVICESAKGGLLAVPERIHHLKPAVIKDLSCIADGSEFCEWEIRWEPKLQGHFVGPVGGILLGGSAFAYFQAFHPDMSAMEAVFLALFPAIAFWLANNWRLLHKEVQTREKLIEEQLHFVEARHEELREAYLEQELTSVELKRRVGQLTTLHRTGLRFSSTLNRKALVQSVLETMIRELRYDRAMIAFYDKHRQVSHDIRILGVSEDIMTFARSIEIPVKDPDSPEGTVLLKGQPILIKDLQEVWNQLHPLDRQLAQAAKAKAVISVPLKVKDVVLGSLTVDRMQEGSLTEDDLNLVMTVATQAAIALDNTDAYHQIEQLNLGLEAKVHERTAELEKLNAKLEAANKQLQELNQIKSAFVSIVSHELRTPMTSIKGYVENMLDGLTGNLTEKQSYYLSRVKFNTERLTRMINDLLDLSRMEAGRVEFNADSLALQELVADVVEAVQPLADEKGITIHHAVTAELPPLVGDRDKLYQVLTNLIQNGIKFTPKGGEVRVRCEALDSGFVQVCVADTGCGIPPNEIDKVFDKFYRGESVPPEARGAGLGLAITKGLVELHGGRIWATSQLGQGTEFYFTVPTKTSGS